MTLPIGYADGVPRRLGTLPDRAGADVLVGGRRCPIVGVVTMDQLMVDVGDLDVSVGDRAVLIGEQGDERIRVEEWADRLGTIGYEIVCGISKRIPRMGIGGRARWVSITESCHCSRVRVHRSTRSIESQMLLRATSLSDTYAIAVGSRWSGARR